MNITDAMLQDYTAFSPIDTAIYRVRGGALETLFLSENIPGLLGMSREEYLKVTEKDAMDLALVQDRSGLIAAAAACIQTGEVLDYYYRVYSNSKGFDWVHVDAHVCGTMAGDPIIIARFANISKEGGIFETILDNSNRITLVAQRDTHEILYANDQIRRSPYFTGNDLMNKTCHGLLKGLEAPCGDCMSSCPDSDELLHEKYIYDETVKKWNLVTWKNVTWCMRDAVIIYIKDVTEEKNGAISLNRMNQMYRMAVEDAKQMLWEYDPKPGSSPTRWIIPTPA